MDSQIITGATSPVYIVDLTGYYLVQITDSNGCMAQSNNEHIVVTGIGNFTLSNQIEVYPNPFLNSLFIKTSQEIKVEQIAINDVLGNAIFSNKYSGSADNTLLLDVSELPAGVYNLKIKAGNEEDVREIIKVK